MSAITTFVVTFSHAGLNCQLEGLCDEITGARWINGFVQLPQSHPWWGNAKTGADFDGLAVHGGVTLVTEGKVCFSTNHLTLAPIGLREMILEAKSLAAQLAEKGSLATQLN